MSELLWSPSPARIAAEPITAFMEAAETVGGPAAGAGYAALHRWSVEAPEAFWSLLWDFAGVRASERGTVILEDGERFPGARWFPGAQLNYAENLLRRDDDRTAVIGLLEDGRRRTLTHGELFNEVSRLAAALRDAGVRAGDRVAGFMPNLPETLVAMLATASIGAVWSSCSPDFGVNGVLDRFGQIAPKVLFAADGYLYNGKRCDSLERLRAVSEAIDSIETIVVVPLLAAQPALDGLRGAHRYGDFLVDGTPPLAFAQLPFDHPLFIMYSSGTTGVPKCIVHGAGGTLLQHLKEHRLQVGLRPGDVFFYFTTCGWMMWNWLVSGAGQRCHAAALRRLAVRRRGQPAPRCNRWRRHQRVRYQRQVHRGPRERRQAAGASHDLDSLRTILSTGSPLSHESFEYVYRDFKADVCLSSISGGTDILSCFVGGCPVLPVRCGEIQAAGLGMAVEIWNDAGAPVRGEKGELVCTRPFPSCPIGFWNDADGARFRAAYFDRWPGVWAHGDYGELTAHDGFVIHGRSDAVLNPGGVRIGTAEIYRQVERIPEVLESIVIGQHWADDVRVVLFVVLREGCELDEDLCARIRRMIRDNTTPRHVPAKIVRVADIPRTISGKIVELAVRNVVHGEAVKNTDALANPEALALYRDLPELRD
jgi:acetoacetyl-CoA synthetase